MATALMPCAGQAKRFSLPKTVRVDEIELTDYNDEEKTASIRVVCGKGTYIRSLARDIGRALDSGAYLTALRRTKAGSFAVENCISFEHFQEWLDEQPRRQPSAIQVIKI